MLQRKNPAVHTQREIELDFIRGLAILLVLDFHSPSPILLRPLTYLGWPHFGWVGVDIFFVLSGFLIGGLLIREYTLRGTIDIKRFLIRRGFKIWPQYYCFLLLMLLTGHRRIHELWGNFLNIQNYVGGVPHTWTLAVEEQAYIILVLVLAVSIRYSKGIRLPFIVLAILSCGILLWRFILAAHGVDVFKRTDTRVDGIFYGVMLAMAYNRVPLLFRRLQNYKWICVSFLIVTLGIFRTHSQAWWWPPLSYVLADVSGIAVLLLLYQKKGTARYASCHL